MPTNFKRTFGNATSPLALSYLDDNFSQLEAAGTSTVSLSGAQLIGYMQSGSGSGSSRSVQTEIREVAFNPKSGPFGAQGDNSTDDTTAFSNVVSAGKHIHIPAGTYLVDTVALSAAGYTIEGDGPGITILKARAGATKLLDIQADYITVKNLTLDMTNMTDANTNYAIYHKNSFGCHFEQVKVINVGTNKISYFADATGVYNSTFVNVDFGSAGAGATDPGKIKLTGTSLSDAITTLTFIGCSFSKVDADYCVNINFINPIVQGALDKFDIANINGFYITGGDIEGTGTYLVIGSTVSKLFSIANELSGFSGTYSSGSFTGGALMDIYGSTNFQIMPTDGQQVAITGILNASRSSNGLVRHILGNGSNGASRNVDLQLVTNGSASESLFMGVNQAAATVKGYLDNRSGGEFQIQHVGGARFGVDANGIGFYGVTPIARATLATGAGATVDNVITALQNLGLVKQS